MNINIRESICNNFINSDRKDIEDSINDSMKDGEEIILPGLGVFFEIIWNNSNEEMKEKILNILESNLKKH